MDIFRVGFIARVSAAGFSGGHAVAGHDGVETILRVEEPDVGLEAGDMLISLRTRPQDPPIVVPKHNVAHWQPAAVQGEAKRGPGRPRKAV